MFLFRRSNSPLPGPPRFFLYLEAALLLLLSLSLLSSYTKRYPLFNQTDSSRYQIQEEVPEAIDGQENSSEKTKENTKKESADHENTMKENVDDGSKKDGEKKVIKWVDFTVTAEAMDKAFRLDLDTCLSEPHLNWIELLAYLGARYGGDFSRYKASDLDQLAQKLLDGESMENLTKDLNYYSYYREAYTAVLGGMVGVFREEIPAEQAPQTEDSSQQEQESESRSSSETSPEDTVWVTKYGLKAFSPIAKGFPYSDFDDFGTARSYGFKRQHLGHDMMGQVGTPIFIKRYILFCAAFLL